MYALAQIGLDQNVAGEVQERAAQWLRQAYPLTLLDTNPNCDQYANLPNSEHSNAVSYCDVTYASLDPDCSHQGRVKPEEMSPLSVYLCRSC